MEATFFEAACSFSVVCIVDYAFACVSGQAISCFAGVTTLLSWTSVLVRSCFLFLFPMAMSECSAMLVDRSVIPFLTMITVRIAPVQRVSDPLSSLVSVCAAHLLAFLKSLLCPTEHTFCLGSWGKGGGGWWPVWVRAGGGDEEKVGQVKGGRRDRVHAEMEWRMRTELDSASIKSVLVQTLFQHTVSTRSVSVLRVCTASPRRAALDT